MSRFHARIRDIFEDVHRFLVHTLKNEVLSSSAFLHKEKLSASLSSLQKEYPELQLKFSEEQEPHNASTKPDFLYPRTSSSVPYVDMNGGSWGKSSVFYTKATPEDSSYHVPIMREKFENLSFAESDDYGSDDAKSLPYVCASDLSSCDKAGYLDKKKRETIKGWLNPFQRRWCAINNGILYYYDKSSDKKQRGSISLQGYEVRIVPDDYKDSRRHGHCFELVCPGKRTYQFSASSLNDLNQWVSAIERNSGTAYPSKSAKTEDSTKIQIRHPSLFLDDDDIYESVLEDSDQTEPNDQKPLVSSVREDYSDVDAPNFPEEEYSDVGATHLPEEEYSDVGPAPFGEEEYSDIGATNLPEEEYSDIGTIDPPEEEYSDIVTIFAESKKMDYSEWYVGLWDCTGEDQNELSFSRGDLIHVVSKEHDSYGWWVGKLNGKMGLVPKSFLMQAYETC